MSDYIKREDAIARILACERVPGTDQQIKVVDAYDAIRTLPAAPVREVRKGYWIGTEYDGYADGAPVYDKWECSECGDEQDGEDIPDRFYWCPNCGADMREPVADIDVGRKEEGGAT